MFFLEEIFKNIEEYEENKILQILQNDYIIVFPLKKF